MKFKCPICHTESQYKGICYDCVLKHKTYLYYVVLGNKYNNDSNSETYADILAYKDTYEKVEKHKLKLQARQKYEKGELITSLDELAKQEYVYINDKIYNYGWFMSMQLMWLNRAKERKSVFKAIKKEN